MKKIRMFNVGHGDCFCLRDRKKNLLVDCGTSNQKIGEDRREEVFDRIGDNIAMLPKRDLLLTKIYPDHMAGILSWWNKDHPAGVFETVYLPDLFSEEKMNLPLALMLLADFKQESLLPGRQVSLPGFYRALIRKEHGEVVFLKRGDLFAEKYRVLWPLPETLADMAGEWKSRIPSSYEKALEELSRFAGILREMVCSLDGRGEEKEHISMDRFQRELTRVRREPGTEALLGWLEKNPEFSGRLDEFCDWTSVVFQNCRDGELNLLFTGDAPPDCLSRILSDFDKMVPVYDHYWCIKVPHHGTDSHYYDFSAYTPDNLLIPNGVYLPEKKRQEAYRTSARYAGLFYIGDATMYCSENGCCDGCPGHCTCGEYNIISPALYQDL